MIAYNIMDPKNPVRFVIFFAIPWSRGLYSNWYGLTFIADGQILDSQFYSNIYYHPAWKTHMTESAFGYVSEWISLMGNALDDIKGQQKYFFKPGLNSCRAVMAENWW